MAETKPTVAILIPCHNEEKTIAHCVDSCLAQSDRPDQIVVVDDGSTDDSSAILDTYKDQIEVIRIPKATGAKSKAQEVGLTLITADVFIATDGDTILHPHFVKRVRQHFTENPQLGAVAGAVQSMQCNYLTALREIDYVLSNNVYKLAQSYTNFLLVISGCSGGFRTSLFRDGTIKFEHDTLTEDLDFTYKLHEQNFRILFDRQAISYTQDPPTISSYTNQMRRWYGGAWQNLRKHLGVVRHPRAALHLTLSYIEGVLFAILLVALLITNVVWLANVLLIYTAVAVVMGLYAAVLRKRLDLLLVSPLLVPLNLLNTFIFMEQFVKEFVLRRQANFWYKPERREVVKKTT